MPTANPNAENESETQRLVSPFAQTTSTVHTAQAKSSVSWPLWIVSSLLVLVLLGVIGYFTANYLEDPYRTLKPFPVDDYLKDYRSLTGAKFRADLKVSADLGSKSETGRLMVFTMQDQTQPLVVLIPPRFAGIYFTKGQNYRASLEVGEGGLIYADTCEKE